MSDIDLQITRLSSKLYRQRAHRKLRSTYQFNLITLVSLLKKRGDSTEQISQNCQSIKMFLIPILLLFTSFSLAAPVVDGGF